MQVPPKSDFPGTGEGNGISPSIRSQGEWIRQVVNTDGQGASLRKEPAAS